MVPPLITRTPAPSCSARLHRFDPRLVDRHRQPGVAFGKDLGELAAVGQRRGQHALGHLGLDQPADAHGLGRFPATSIRRPAATKSSAAGERVGRVVAGPALG